MTTMLLLRKVRLLAAYPRAVAAHPGAALRYLLRDREFTNLTYEIENTNELAAFVAEQLTKPLDEIEAYLSEPQRDEPFLRELRAALRTRGDRNDEPRFGRRLGWYAVVRALRPELVVETGVHDGLGSALLLRALERNGTGRLMGFDMTAESGWLVPASLRGRYELVLGDVRETLPRELTGRRVDVIIHDSLHTYEHERFELALALAHGAENLALMSDNAHASDALFDLCREHRLSYGLFRERPRAHFYPGAGLGLALRRAAATASTSSSVSSG
jgi:predicted O-methyltransferase YrrM